MKQLFEKHKYEIVEQGGVNLVVCGYSDSQVIGATKKEVKDRTWTKLDKGSYVLPTYEGSNYIYINCELLSKN